MLVLRQLPKSQKAIKLNLICYTKTEHFNKKMKKLQTKTKKEFRRIAEYMVSGGAQFWSGYAAFAVLDLVFKIPFWPNRVLSYAFGVIVNFYLQRFWVFGKQKLSKKQLHTSAEKYYTLMFINFLLDLAIVGGLYELAGVSPYIGQFVSAGFFTVYNYLLFKFWVFRVKKRENKHHKKHFPVHATHLHKPMKRNSIRKKSTKKSK